MLIALGSPADAQSYPARPIRFVNPSPAGTGADILVRFIGTRVQALAGQPIVIENKPGANGNIANEYVVRSKPDGYTVLFAASSAVVANRYVMKGATFDPMKDLDPVGSVLRVGLVLAVPPNSPGKTLPDLIAHLKSKSAKVLYGVPSTSVVGASELFKMLTGTQGQPVNYRAMADVIKDVASGDIDYTFIDATNGLAQARAGRMLVLGTSTQGRLSVAPDLPTLTEAGLKDYEYINFWGAYLAARSPPEAIGKLAGWLDQVVKMEETRKFLLDQASEPWPSTPESLTKQMLEHDALWRRIVDVAKIVPQ